MEEMNNPTESLENTEHLAFENLENFEEEEAFADDVVLPTESDLEFPNVEVVQAKVAEGFESPEMQAIDEHLWQARTGLNEDTLCGAIETIIFMSDKPVPITKIKSLIDEDMPLRVIHEALQRLQAEYELKHHGIRLLEVAEGYQYRTKATFSKYVQDIFKINQLVLSPTALEVLAVIAYKQPVSKTEVDKIRGVDSSHIVRALMDKRLVRTVGRSEELGRPVLYGTTPEFLEVFNLADLSQLPPEHELEAMSYTNVGKIADIKTLVQSGDKSKFKFDELAELDQLSESIKQISSDTDFTISLKVEEKKRMSEEGIEVKSAFDLIEEFVNRRVISVENENATHSELMNSLICPKVIDDLEAGPFNLPEVAEEEEEFQMIDLDTGLPITDDWGTDETVIELSEDGDYDSGLSEDEFDIIVDLDFDKEEDEAAALSKALDDAFERLTGEKLEEINEKELGQELEVKSQEIDGLEDEMIAKGQEFDLDLSFLKESIEKNISFEDLKKD